MYIRKSTRKDTTPNVIRAKARKARNRILREIADREKAARLGITVEELHYRQVCEVVAIIDNYYAVAAKIIEAQRKAREVNYYRRW